MQSTQDTHLYASLLLWALKQQMGKMVDLGLSRPPTLHSPYVPALACQAKSARVLDPLSPLRGVSVWGGKGLAQQSMEHG